MGTTYLVWWHMFKCIPYSHMIACKQARKKGKEEGGLRMQALDSSLLLLSVNHDQDLCKMIIFYYCFGLFCALYGWKYTAAHESNNWAKQNEYEVIITSYWAKIDLYNRFFQIRNLCKSCPGRLGILTDDYRDMHHTSTHVFVFHCIHIIQNQPAWTPGYRCSKTGL